MSDTESSNTRIRFVLQSKSNPKEVLRYNVESFELTLSKDANTRELVRSSLSEISRVKALAPKVSHWQANEEYPYCPKDIDLSDFMVISQEVKTTTIQKVVVETNPVVLKAYTLLSRPVNFLKQYVKGVDTRDATKFDIAIVELSDGLTLGALHACKNLSLYVEHQFKGLMEMEVWAVGEVPDYFSEDHHPSNTVMLCGVLKELT